MKIQSDTRGQSVWIGFLLLVFFLILLLTFHQAVIIPEQNAKVEFHHELEMQERMSTVRDRIYLTGAGGGTQSVTFDPSPEYPPRLITLNPPPAIGRLATRTEGNISLTVDGDRANLSEACGYGGKEIPTRELAFDIDYNEYENDPTIVYSGTTLYKETNGSYLFIDRDHQSVIKNDSITIRPLSNPYSRAAATPFSLQVIAGPVGKATVTANDSASLTIPTQLPASEWETLLADQQSVQSVTQTSDTSVAIKLEPDTYTVTCYGVGLNQAPPFKKRPIRAYVPNISNSSK